MLGEGKDYEILSTEQGASGKRVGQPLYLANSGRGWKNKSPG